MRTLGQEEAWPKAEEKGKNPDITPTQPDQEVDEEEKDDTGFTSFILCPSMKRREVFAWERKTPHGATPTPCRCVWDGRQLTGRMIHYMFKTELGRTHVHVVTYVGPW